MVDVEEFHDTTELYMEKITIGELLFELNKCKKSGCFILEAFMLAHMKVKDMQFICELMSNIANIESLMKKPLEEFDVKCAIHNKLTISKALSKNKRIRVYFDQLLEIAKEKYGESGIAGEIIPQMIAEQQSNIEHKFSTQNCTSPEKHRSLKYKGNWNKFCPPYHELNNNTKCCDYKPKRRMKASSLAVVGARKWSSLSKYCWKLKDVEKVIDKDPKLSINEKEKMKEDWEFAQDDLADYLKRCENDPNKEKEFDFFRDILQNIIRKAEVFVKRTCVTDLETRERFNKARWLSVETLEWAAKRSKDRMISGLFYALKHPQFLKAMILVLEYIKDAACYKLSLNMGLVKEVDLNKKSNMTIAQENLDYLSKSIKYWNDWAALMADPTQKFGMVVNLLNIFCSPLKILPGWGLWGDVFITSIVLATGDGIKEWVWLQTVSNNFYSTIKLLDFRKCIRQIEVDTSKWFEQKQGTAIGDKAHKLWRRETGNEDEVLPYINPFSRHFQPKEDDFYTRVKYAQYDTNAPDEQKLFKSITMDQAAQEVVDNERDPDAFKKGFNDAYTRQERSAMTPEQQILFDKKIWEIQNPGKNYGGPSRLLKK